MFPALLEAKCQQFVFEYANREMAEIGMWKEVGVDREVACGVVDVKSFYMETPEDVAERVRLCLKHIPAERLSLVPDCGFFPVPRWVAAEKLKRLAAGGAAAAGAIGFPAVARAQARAGVPAGPVKIGVLAIRAGIAAPVGTAGLRGTEWWADRVNKAGGTLGRPVQLVVEEESNPKDTVERFRKLVLQDKVEA